MITESDSYNHYDRGDYYAILPQIPTFDLESWKTEFNAVKVEPGFKYNSGNNTDWLTVENLRDLINEHVTPSSVQK